LVVIAQCQWNDCFDKSVPGDSVSLPQRNVTSREIDMENIAENKLHRTSLCPDDKVDTSRVIIHLLLQLVTEQKHDRYDGNT
jgi:hypothetical protein